MNLLKMMKTLCLLVLLLAGLQPANAQWVSNGPAVTGTSYNNTLAVKGGKIFAGTSSGLYVSADSGASWSALTSASPGPGTKAIIAIHANGNNLFCSVNSDVFFSTNDGASWTNVSGTLPGGPIVKEFASIGTSVFAACQGSGVYMTNNNGATWTARNTGSGVTLPYHIYADDSALYVCSENINQGIYKSTNLGLNWSSIGGPNGGNYGVTAIAAKGPYVYAGTSGHSVYMTNNNGSTWNQITNGISATYNIYSLLIIDTTQAACTGNVVVGTQTGGLFMAPTDGSQWTAINTGLPTGGFNRALALMGTKLFVQTSGSGVYQRTLPTVGGIVTPPTITPTKTSICSGDTSRLCATGGFSTYRWSNGPTGSCITVNQGGAFTVTVSDANGCTAQSTALTITSTPGPSASISAGGPTALCANDSVQLCVSANFNQYQWSVGAANTKCVQAKQSGTYYVTVTDGNGCTAESNRITVTAGTAPVATIAVNGANPFCANDSAEVCVGSNFNAYSWNGGESSQCIQVKAAGNYYVTVTDANGCTAESNRVSLSVYPVQQVSVTVKGDTLTAFNGLSYQWYNNGSPIQGATDSVYIAPAAGSYTVRISDANGCNVFSNPFVITAVEQLTGDKYFELYPNPNTTGLLQVMAGAKLAGGQLQVYNASGQLVLSQVIENTAATIDISGLAAGVYTLNLHNAAEMITRKLLVTK